MAEGGDFQLAEPMQASGRELGQEPDESEVGLLEDSTDKVGEEATQGELEGANQETEATPSEVCDSGQQVKRSGRSRASAVVDMKDLREGVDYGDNSPSQAKRNRTSTSETWKHVRRLLSRELKGAPTDDGLAENTHICTKCGMLLKLTKSKVTSGLSMGWQSLSGLKRWLQSNRHVCLMVRHVETLYHINQHGLFACVPLTSRNSQSILAFLVYFTFQQGESLPRSSFSSRLSSKTRGFLY